MKAEQPIEQPSIDDGTDGFSHCQRCGGRTKGPAIGEAALRPTDKTTRCCMACATPAELAKAKRDLQDRLREGNTKAIANDLARMQQSPHARWK